MSWPKSIPKPIPIPPTAPDLYTVTVEVFDGPFERDEKIPGASVTLGDRSASADGAGNAHLFQVPRGVYPLEVSAPGFVSEVDRIEVPGSVVRVSLERDVPAILPLAPAGPIFRLPNGAAHRIKGVSCFRGPQRFADGEDISDVFRAYAGFNMLRSWLYAETGALGQYAFDLTGRWQVVRDYITACNRAGFRVELTLLTSARADAQPIVSAAFYELADFSDGLLIELVNEPDVYDKPDTSKLVVPADTKILWASGDYLNPWKMRGAYGCDHSPRDAEWMRKGGHNAKEFYEGGGPGAPDWPPHHFPILEDEPHRLDKAGYNVRAVLAYFGTCGQMACGATVHPKSGLLGLAPTDEEPPCIAAALAGLDAFPADTPLGAYRIIDEAGENTLRTYVKGERAMVRVEPRTPDAPEPGWTPIGTEGILWKR